MHIVLAFEILLGPCSAFYTGCYRNAGTKLKEAYKKSKNKTFYMNDKKRLTACFWNTEGVLFENRPALNFCNYVSITVYKIYIFLFRIKDTV